MATKFLEPGGDADFSIATTNGFWGVITGSPTVATDFIHGGHIKSLAFSSAGGTAQLVQTADSVIADAGARISFYVYFNTLPAVLTTIFIIRAAASGNIIASIRLSSASVLQIWNASTAQIGTNGATLSTGIWYRISLAYTITSTTVNRFELFKDGVSTISITNATITNTTTSSIRFGNNATSVSFDMRLSDIYVDDSSALTDPGNVWVTAKRPNANGTTNGFTTQIGAGGSGYGSGHSPQVNERALSTTNGWSMVGAGSAVTEEYNIEGLSTGDIDLTGATIVDWVGWVSIKSLAGETINMILNGASVAQAITSTITIYKKVKGSSTYPAGTGTDIGVQTDTSLTTVSLYECGVIVAYIPAAPSSAIKTFNGNTYANTSKVNGRPIAEVKTWNGLA